MPDRRLVELTLPDAFAAGLKSPLAEARIRAVEGVKAALPVMGSVGVRAIASLLQDPDEAVRTSARVALIDFAPFAEEATPALVVTLGAADWKDRAGAAHILGKIGPPAAAAAPKLAVVAAKDESDLVRTNAVDALARIGTTQETLKTILAALHDRSNLVRWSAMRALGRTGLDESEALPWLITALGDVSYEGDANHAEEALARMGPRTIPALMPALASPQHNVAVGAARVLTRLGPAAAPAVPALVALLSNADLRWVAVEALGAIGPAAVEAVPALREIVVATDLGSGGENAGRALARIGGGPHREVVAELLRQLGASGEEDTIPKSAIRRLGALGVEAKDAVPVLLDIMNPRGGKTRWLAIDASDALGRIGPAAREAVPSLIGKISSDDEVWRSHRREIAVALGRIGGPDVRALVRSWAKELSPADEDRLGLLRLIGPEAVDALPTLLAWFDKATTENDGSLAFRVCPILAAVGRNDDRLMNAYMRCLKTKGNDQSLHEYVIESMRELGPAARAAVPLLCEPLKDLSTNGPSRELCMATLGAIGPDAKEALPLLMKARISSMWQAFAEPAVKAIDPDYARRHGIW